MNNFDLIEQIHMRLPLWDKAHIDKTDVNTREELWDEVAHVMGCSKDILKSRWKNLRDSYRKIIKNRENRDSEPKWPYYNAMEFMREITMNSRPKVVDITRKSMEPDFSMNVRSDSADCMETLMEGVKQEKGIKRQVEDDIVTQFLEIESGKTNPDDRNNKNAIEDDDYQFLLSLHQHFKQVPINRKLPLRMKIEQLIYDEIYSQNAANNRACQY